MVAEVWKGRWIWFGGQGEETWLRERKCLREPFLLYYYFTTTVSVGEGQRESLRRGDDLREGPEKLKHREAGIYRCLVGLVREVEVDLKRVDQVKVQ